MEVTRVVSAPFEVNVYVVKDGADAWIVDASSGLDWATFWPRLERAIGGATVREIFLTHVHIDHVGGAARLSEATGAPVTMLDTMEADAVERGDADLTGAALFGAPATPVRVQRVAEGGHLAWGRHRFEVLRTPGHSPGHAVLWCPEEATLFAGDVVFAMGAFGRVDLPGADPKAMLTSIRRLAALSVDALYAGHLDPVPTGAARAIADSLRNARAMLA